MTRQILDFLILFLRVLIVLIVAVTLISFTPVPVRTISAGSTAAQKTENCEDLKKQISQLEEFLSEESKALGRLEAEADRISGAYAEYLKKYNEWAKSASYSLLGEHARGILLDNLAKLGEALRKVRGDIEETKLTIQALKEVIADLLNKLGSCSATPNPSPTPTPTPTPNGTAKPANNTNNQVGFHVDTKTANGLFVTTFDTPNGKIKVNLPDDMSAGDTITGTVECEPKGKDDSERAKNQAELNGEVIQIGGQQTKVGDKKISCTIPNPLNSEAKTIVLLNGGHPVATSEIPISITPPPTPTQFTLPTGGQQGRPIEIKGPCNGIIGPMDTVKIGGTVLPPLAESPRQIIVQDTNNTLGPTTIECNENGAKLECPFRNIGIKLSAPKLSLLRGETTTLHVVVMGLSGIKDDLPLDLINNSPSVIKMSEGDAQHLTIPHIQVNADGTFTIERTLTGIMTGGFGVTGTVWWPNVCKSP